MTQPPLRLNLKDIVVEIEARTNIQVRGYRRIVMGWEYIVLDVNDSYIFRVPRSQNRWSRLQREVTLVKWLSNHLSTPLPNYEFVSQGGTKQHVAFAGYRKLDGYPCTLRNFRIAWLSGMGEDVGRFLSELHSLRLPDSLARNLDRYSPKTWAAYFHKKHIQVKRLAYPLLSRPHRKFSERIWSELFSTIDNVRFRPTLVHGDLTGGNLLCDSKGQLKGVIDWSDAPITDPAFDFAGLLTVDRRLAVGALDNYQRDKSGLLERAELYLRTIPLREIASGVEQESSRIIQMGLSDFRRWSLPA
jgi:aminoglycoside 2''-phosphotransferase